MLPQELLGSEAHYRWVRMTAARLRQPTCGETFSFQSQENTGERSGAQPHFWGETRQINTPIRIHNLVFFLSPALSHEIRISLVEC